MQLITGTKKLYNMETKEFISFLLEIKQIWNKKERFLYKRLKALLNNTICFTVKSQQRTTN